MNVAETTNANADTDTEFYVGLMCERIPERSEELRAKCVKLQVKFCHDVNSETAKFRADSSKNSITVGIKGLTRLLAHAVSYASAHYHFLHQLKKTPSGVNEQAVSALFLWALKEDFKAKEIEKERDWPERLLPNEAAQLVSQCLPTKQMNAAEGIFADAMTFILLHELVHLERAHIATQGLRSIEHEKEADQGAAAWMLDNLTSGSIEWKKRLWGIASALTWRTAATFHSGPSGSDRHPPAHDRLFQTLNQFIDGEEQEHDIWLFACVALSLPATLMEIDHGVKLAEVGPKETVNLLLNEIANKPSD